MKRGGGDEGPLPRPFQESIGDVTELEPAVARRRQLNGERGAGRSGLEASCVTSCHALIVNSKSMGASGASAASSRRAALVERLLDLDEPVFPDSSRRTPS